MTNLNFADRLINNPFVSNNNYLYHNPKPTNLRFYKDCTNFPYIMCNPYQSDQTLLHYCDHNIQLRSRLLNTARIKEVMDSAHMPLMFSIRGKWYLIGKGFLAHSINMHVFGESFKLLFVACTDSTRIPRYITDIRFFVSRDIYKEDYKAILPAVKDIMIGHTGDVILTSDIENRIGDKITFPVGGSLKDREKYKREIVLECIKDCF